eukprot:TRINITY_DN25865_c0_g1_i4.p1 TRINITY_DN25865_c0_g1~~TRINITY_DN25865_c0_g1_i4.p1  ORF type:complete len:842 (-),score=154.45 TRINITY_DN25865_c0_g1_i4:187-2712(-)
MDPASTSLHGDPGHDRLRHTRSPPAESRCVYFGMDDQDSPMDRLPDASYFDGMEDPVSPSGYLEGRGFSPEALKQLLPWFLSVLIGIGTALTGSFVAVASDFLGDMRFGYCRGISLADRHRCCGGAENIDVLRDACMPAQLILMQTAASAPEWREWADIFESERGTMSPGVVYTVVAVAFASLAAFIVSCHCLAARGDGLASVKAAVAGFDLPDAFSVRCLLTKTVGLAFAVGAGLTLGKEGPLMHLGACWAFLLVRSSRPLLDNARQGQPWESSSKPVMLHELLCVGTASGIATAFGAPLGGVLFVAEELRAAANGAVVSGRTLLLAFLSAFSASLTVKALNLYGSKRLMMFALSTSSSSPTREWVAWEMAVFILLGVVGGVVGAAFVALQQRFEEAREEAMRNDKVWLLPDFLQLHKMWWRPADGQHRRAAYVLEAGCLALFTASTNYPTSVLLRGSIIEAIHALFETCPHARAVHFGLCSSAEDDGWQFNVSAWSNAALLLAAAVRLVQLACSFGQLALPAGLFVPSMYIGACLGRCLGNLTAFVVGTGLAAGSKVHVEPGIFALVGAAAMLSGVCRTTVSLVVIMVELTGEYTCVVPLMCAVLTSKLVADSLTPSIYAVQSALAGFTQEPDLDAEAKLGLLATLAEFAEPCREMSLEDIEALELQPGQQHGRRPEHIEDPIVATARKITFSAAGGVGRPKILGVVASDRLWRWQRSCREDCQDAGGPSRALASEASGSILSCIDADVVCMDREAPLLSGLCVFHEKPTLKFIVVIQCRSLGGSRAAAERGSEILGVIPRHRLQVERLLSTRRRLRRPASGDANHLELALQRSAADAI